MRGCEGCVERGIGSIGIMIGDEERNMEGVLCRRAIGAALYGSILRDKSKPSAGTGNHTVW